MSSETRTTKEGCCAPSEGMSFSAMMEKMMSGWQGQGCNCTEMMAQMMGQQEVDCDCVTPGVMAEYCEQAYDEGKTTSTETPQQA